MGEAGLGAEAGAEDPGMEIEAGGLGHQLAGARAGDADHRARLGYVGRGREQAGERILQLAGDLLLAAGRAVISHSSGPSQSAVMPPSLVVVFGATGSGGRWRSPPAP